ncbi:MAG: hypothetical protein R3B13_33110 [Polyangiaceae bacterium]
MNSRYLIGTLSALALTLGAAEAVASYPVAVWVKARKVELEPDAKSPTRVRIHGAAMLYDKSATGTAYGGYTDPAWGFLYYECPKGDEATCVSEWADIEKNIKDTDDICVGFGSQTQNPGTLHPWGSKALYKTDVYPISMGVVTGYTPCIAIENFIKTNGEPGSAGAGGAGGGAGSAGSAGAGGSGTAGGAGSAGTPGTAGSAGSPGGGGSSGSASSGGTNSGSSGAGGGSSTAGTSGGDSSDDGGCSISGAPAVPTAFFWLTALSALGFGLRRRSGRR